MPNYTITPEDFLYRRFPIIDEPRFQVFFEIKDGKKVPTSAAFKTKPGEDGLSVDIKALTTPENSVIDPVNYGLAEIPASVPLGLGYPCIHDPQPGNNAHAIIKGDTNPIAKKLKKAITNVITF